MSKAAPQPQRDGLALQYFKSVDLIPFFESMLTNGCVVVASSGYIYHARFAAEDLRTFMNGPDKEAPNSDAYRAAKHYLNNAKFAFRQFIPVDLFHNGNNARYKLTASLPPWTNRPAPSKCTRNTICFQLRSDSDRPTASHLTQQMTWQASDCNRVVAYI